PLCVWTTELPFGSKFISKHRMSFSEKCLPQFHFCIIVSHQLYRFCRLLLKQTVWIDRHLTFPLQKKNIIPERTPLNIFHHSEYYSILNIKSIYPRFQAANVSCFIHLEKFILNSLFLLDYNGWKQFKFELIWSLERR